jgi:predicted nucleic acid-binding protein
MKLSEDEEKYILDTSAILSFRDDEAGANYVENLLLEAEAGKIVVYISFISLIEVYTTVWETEGEESAKRTYAEMKMLPLTEVSSSEEVILKAGFLISRYGLPLSEAIIGGSALVKEAILVHKNATFEKISHLLQSVSLPRLDLSLGLQKEGED